MYLSIFYNITFCLKNNDRILYDLNNFTPYSNNEIDQGCIGLNHCDNDMIQPKNSKLTLLELVFQTAGAINLPPPKKNYMVKCLTLPLSEEKSANFDRVDHLREVSG